MTLEQVRGEKQALKLIRRQLKESEALRRRHAKERNDVQRQQCSVFDKLLQQHDRQRLQAERNKKHKSVQRVLLEGAYVSAIYTVSQKTILDIFSCNLNKLCLILIFFARALLRDLAIKSWLVFPTSPDYFFCTI